MRTIGVSLGVAGAALWLVLAGDGVARAVAPTAGPALNQLQATQAAVTQMQQNPPAVPNDVPHAKDINEASRQLMAWQAEMFRQRDELARKQAKMLHDRMKVPPPLPPSEPEPPMTRLDIPLPLWPANVNLSVSMGEPSVSFSVGAEAEALSCVGASYKVETAYVASENRWTVADPLEISASFGTDSAEVTGSYQLLTSVFTGSHGQEAAKEKEVSGELSFDIFQVSTAFGYNSQREFSMGVGYDFVSTPEKFSKFFKASVGVEAGIGAPLVVHGLTQGGKHGLPTVLADYSAKLAKYLTEPRPCPYCTAKGALDCPTCHNARNINCPDCKGEKRYHCHECSGGGDVSCPRCKGSGQQSCGSCGGKGRLKCPTCHGRGTMRYWKTGTATRQKVVIDSIGFDSAGQPVYERHTEPEEYETSVPYWDDCGTCGGSGDGGACGRCNATGRVTCGKCKGTKEVGCKACKGTGWKDCGKCHRTGKVTCPTCGGKPLVCPLCKGKVSFGH